MIKLAQTITDGLTSARSGRRHLERALKEEWRASRVAQQDRAHLATVAYAPSLCRPDLSPAAPLSRSLQPPLRS